MSHPDEATPTEKTLFNHWPKYDLSIFTTWAEYLVCTCKQQEGICWWEDKGPVQTLDWRQGCGKSDGPDTRRELSATVEKTHIDDETKFVKDPKPWIWAIFKLKTNNGFAYFNSNWRSTFYVLFHSLVRVYCGAQMLVRNPSSIEGWQDRHWRLGGTLDGERVSFTGVGRVVLQDVEKIDCKRSCCGAT